MLTKVIQAGSSAEHDEISPAPGNADAREMAASQPEGSSNTSAYRLNKFAFEPVGDVQQHN